MRFITTHTQPLAVKRESIPIADAVLDPSATSTSCTTHGHPMPVQSQVVIVVNYRDRTMGIYYLNPAGFAQTWYLAHLAHVWHRQPITANPHPRPVKTQFVIVLNYRDQTMVINHLNHAGLLQEWHVRPCPHRQHVWHRQHLTAYPHARPMRRQVIVVVNYGDKTM